MGGSKQSASRSYTHTRGEREKDRSSNRDILVEKRGRSRSTKTKEGDNEHKERTRGRSRRKSMKRDLNINTLQGVREYHIISLVTYIVQVFDETLQGLRDIKEAGNAIFNRIKTVRRFSLDSGNTPNKVNKYFPDDKISVYIKEKYMDCTCRSYWKVVLDLSKYEKVINFRIITLDESEKFEEIGKSNNSDQNIKLQTQVATMTQEIQNLKTQLSNTQISLQQQLQNKQISSISGRESEIPTRSLASTVARGQHFINDNQGVNHGGAASMLEDGALTQIGTNRSLVHRDHDINQGLSQTGYSQSSMRNQNLNNVQRNQSIQSSSNSVLSSGLSGSSILR